MTPTAFVALVTCFDGDERLDLTATRAQVRRQVAAGNALMVAGTNGDFTALTHDEKIALVEAVVDESAGKVPVFANAGMPATFETVQLAQAFERAGVDGIAVITPFFIACTQDGLERHFTRVADAVQTPVYLYDIPARTQNHIEPATARRLAAHGNIAGIKDSGGAQQTLEDYMAIGRDMPGFKVYSGPDHLILWALGQGAAGCISGLGNVMPDTLAQIIAAHRAGDSAGAEAAQARFTAFRTELYALGYPPALVKRALWCMDSSVGTSRGPALLPVADQDQAIREILRRYDLS
ncbi:dihydrodipicolinate synthase family protein [Roseicitreum antarcticum]|uniref:4-hydroxy-tetrahydrodipicolinate synthase n=1 Tax=Roseicitreum antarcticum TaxID=564137 RepID=A0A1H2Z1F8_9RHOB|nr:dihydrodipicolinate synthase family protein [Roseicitreum antarcticum]SDX11171.1 4-hydroxy-tetrahydrodipicolinate synthase [Roseicitreum antarcticum]